jgi:hypothetical protein
MSLKKSLQACNPEIQSPLSKKGFTMKDSKHSFGYLKLKKTTLDEFSMDQPMVKSCTFKEGKRINNHSFCEEMSLEEDLSEVCSKTNSLTTEKEIDESHSRNLKSIYANLKTVHSRNDNFVHSKTVSKLDGRILVGIPKLVQKDSTI